jgi:hypothetical protein
VAGLLGFAVTAPATTAAASQVPPTVTQTANDVTVSLPGVGSLMFSVDPSTGAISNMVATADPEGGFTPGPPKVTDEGVQVSFTPANTSPNAPTQVLHVEVEREDGTVTVTAEAEADQPEDAKSDGNSQGEDQQQKSAPKPSTTVTTEAEHETDNETEQATEHETEHDDSSHTATSSDGAESGSGGGGQD